MTFLHSHCLVFSTLRGLYATHRKHHGLGSGQSSIIDDLDAKAAKIQRLIERYLADPSAPLRRESLRSYLHTLFASAQVFQADRLAGAVKAQIDCSMRLRPMSR